MSHIIEFYKNDIQVYIYIYIYLEKLPLYNGGNHHRGSSGRVQDMLHIIKLYTVHTKNNIYSEMSHNFSL